MIDHSKYRINGTLCPGHVVHSSQLLVDVAPTCNLDVVYTPWNLEEGDRDCPIGCKTKNRRDIMTMGPTIVESILGVLKRSLLEIKL